MAKLINLVGKRFGALVVLARAPDAPCRARKWMCMCDCGQQRVAYGGSLRDGIAISCGCRRGDRLKVHGLTMTPEHKIWASMLGRCSNPNQISYKHYGARGVVVCDEWKSSFIRFLADMGERPSSKHSIERIDPNGNYEPKNCRWATSGEQANNKRNTRYVNYRNQRMALADAVRLAGSVIHYESAWIRIKWGWDVAIALETPPTIIRPNRRVAA